jgi:hypothetical protein
VVTDELLVDRSTADKERIAKDIAIMPWVFREAEAVPVTRAFANKVILGHRKGAGCERPGRWILGLGPVCVEHLHIPSRWVFPAVGVLFFSVQVPAFEFALERSNHRSNRDHHSGPHEFVHHHGNILQE